MVMGAGDLEGGTEMMAASLGLVGEVGVGGSSSSKWSGMPYRFRKVKVIPAIELAEACGSGICGWQSPNCFSETHHCYYCPQMQG